MLIGDCEVPRLDCLEENSGRVGDQSHSQKDGGVEKNLPLGAPSIRSQDI